MSGSEGCSHEVQRTLYVRVSKRSPKTHHLKQWWAPVGWMCDRCHDSIVAIDPDGIYAKRHKPSDSSGNP